MSSRLTSNLHSASYLSLPKAGLTGTCHHIQRHLLELAFTQPKLLSFIKIVTQWRIDGLYFTSQHDTSIKKVLEDLDYILETETDRSSKFCNFGFLGFRGYKFSS